MRKSTLKSVIGFFSSLKLTIGAMVTLGAGVLLNYREIAEADILVTAPLAVLSVNLISALIVNPVIRHNSSLFLFHVSLLALLILVLVDDEFSLLARVEISEGQVFDPAQVVIVKAGRWYQNSLNTISFMQGPVSVEYGPDRVRGSTRSDVILSKNRNAPNRTIGDDSPVAFGGYKFYTTHNKGFSALLEWNPHKGETQKGTVHFPSYPRFEWKQQNFWELPSSRRLSLRLIVLSPPPEKEAWVLENKFSETQLSINDGHTQYLLSPGQSVEFKNGHLSFDHTRMWMGYRISYNPVLPWMFIVAMMAAFFLGWYFLLKFNVFSNRRVGKAIVAGNSRA